MLLILRRDSPPLLWFLESLRARKLAPVRSTSPKLIASVVDRFLSRTSSTSPSRSHRSSRTFLWIPRSAWSRNFTRMKTWSVFWASAAYVSTSIFASAFSAFRRFSMFVGFLPRRCTTKLLKTLPQILRSAPAWRSRTRRWMVMAASSTRFSFAFSRCITKRLECSSFVHWSAAESVAVSSATRTMPTTDMAAATTRPKLVVASRSPYPTVEDVTNMNHIAFQM
mmetsp:Transcript_59917/g.142436  ORF Transcript_59917/g.142436 Transcript_59917/m.142436 type:complete len:224 (-) Transcript_59917:816-1487(-)